MVIFTKKQYRTFLPNFNLNFGADFYSPGADSTKTYVIKHEKTKPLFYGRVEVENLMTYVSGSEVVHEAKINTTSG